MHKPLAEPSSWYYRYNARETYISRLSRSEVNSPNSGTSGSTGSFAFIVFADSSGSGQRIIIERPLKQAGLLNLLKKWIVEYGDNADPDLSTQLQELEKSPLSLRQP